MIDYDSPWGWGTGRAQQVSNTLAPLGTGSQEQGGGVQQLPPSMVDQAKQAAMQKVGGMAVDQAVDGISKYNATQAPPPGEVVDATGGMETAAEAAGNALPAAGVLGPLGAAAGGLSSGEYDKAAGAALGSVLGAYFGPIGSMVGGKVGGYVGDQAGDLFGFAQGTTGVPAGGKNLGQIFGGQSRGINSVGPVNQPARFSNAPKNYFYEFGNPTQGSTVSAVGFTPRNFTSSLQQSSPKVQLPATNPVWGPESFGGGDSAGEGGGGTGADASSGSGVGNGAEGDSAGPGGDAGAGGGGGGGK